MKNIFLRFFVAELLVILAVTVVFRFIPNRLIAGAVAGLIFVALGGWIFAAGVRSRTVRLTGTFALGCIHLFLIALPLMITRLMNATLDFGDVLVFGLPGPLFHTISTGVYFVLMIATVVDFFLSRGGLAASKAGSSNS